MIVPYRGNVRLSEVRTMEVESCLRRLPLAKSSCAQIRNILSVQIWPKPREAPVINQVFTSACPVLAGDPGHFAKTIVREILSPPFFKSLQNERGDEFGLVTLGVLS